MLASLKPTVVWVAIAVVVACHAVTDVSRGTLRGVDDGHALLQACQGWEPGLGRNPAGQACS